MKLAADQYESLRHTIRNPTNGVVGLVDSFLDECPKHGLQIDWQPDQIRVRSHDSEWEELADISLRKSVFRAILSRIAALCNEHAPHSISPYGGNAELRVGGSHPCIIRVAMTNTPDEQRLELATDVNRSSNQTP